MTGTTRIHRLQIVGSIVATVALLQGAEASSNKSTADRGTLDAQAVRQTETQATTPLVPSLSSDSSLSVQDSAQPKVPIASADEVRANAVSDDAPAIPPEWKLLKTYAHSRLPRHRTQQFQAVWAPVIVSGTDDTVPGVGIAGRF